MPASSLIFCSRRLRKSRPAIRPQEQVLNFDILKSSIVTPDQKSLSGLVGILEADVLSELTDENSSLRLAKRALINNDYEGFSRIEAYLKSFWQCSAVMDSRIVVENNRIARPIDGGYGEKLRWWIRPNTSGGLECIGRLPNCVKDCPQCTKFGKNLKAKLSFDSSQPLPKLLGRNEELQLDYAGPLTDLPGNQIFI